MTLAFALFQRSLADEAQCVYCTRMLRALELHEVHSHLPSHQALMISKPLYKLKLDDVVDFGTSVKPAIVLLFSTQDIRAGESTLNDCRHNECRDSLAR